MTTSIPTGRAQGRSCPRHVSEDHQLKEGRIVHRGGPQLSLLQVDGGQPNSQLPPQSTCEPVSCSTACHGSHHLRAKPLNLTHCTAAVTNSLCSLRVVCAEAVAVCVFSFNPHRNSDAGCRYYGWPVSTDEKTEAQRGYASGPESHSQVAEQGLTSTLDFKPGS